MGKDGHGRRSGATESSKFFSPTSAKRTFAAAISPLPEVDTTTPAPHRSWMTVSPAVKLSRSAPEVGAGGRLNAEGRPNTRPSSSLGRSKTGSSFPATPR